VAVEPVVNVLYRRARPLPEHTESSHDVNATTSTNADDVVYLPCLRGVGDPVLATNNVAIPFWRVHVDGAYNIQQLDAIIPSLEHVMNVKKEAKNPDSYQMLWPAIGLHDEVDATCYNSYHCIGVAK
jgi:hypothetical protein